MFVVYTALEGGTTNPNGLLNALGTNVTNISNTSGVFSFIWVFGVVACITAGAFVVAFAGVKLTAADSSAKALEAKKDMKRAVYGVVGILVLWLILNQINPDLLRGDLKFQPIQNGWTSSTDSPDNPPITPVVQPTIPPGSLKSEASVRTLLATIPININNDGRTCSGGKTTGCTNVQGMRDETIGLLRSLRAGCPSCVIEITGGTEPGHKSHGPDLLPVDLKLTDSLSAFIRVPANIISPPARFCLAEYKYQGWRFCDEANTARHWHVYQ